MWSFPRSEKRSAKGDEAAIVESVKAASEVYAPVAGEVVAVNTELEGAPATVNEDAEGPGLVPQAEGRGRRRGRGADGRQSNTRRSWKRSSKSEPMRYLPLTDEDRAEMLARIGVADVDDLFADVPADQLRPRAAQPAAPQGRDRGRARCSRAWPARTLRPARCRSSSAAAPTGTTCRRRSIT